MKDRIYLMRDWFFTEEFTEDMIVDTMDVSLAQTVSLPHTCKETPYHYFDEHTYQMVSCYQKILYAPEGWQGKRLLLTFEAVGHEAEVYVNGKKMAEHHCGYTAFTIDISEALNYGADNLLTVRVDSNETLDQPPFGFVIDYMTYGGIYRDVYLEVKNSIYIEDIFLKPKFAETVTTKGMDAKAIAQMQVSGILASEVTYSVKAQEAISAGQVGIRQIVDDQVVLEAPIATTSFSTPVADVMLWDIESPKVYEVTTQLLYQGQVVDEKSVTVGFREALFQKDGFYLNGRKVRIRGLNRHQSYAYVGYAMPESIAAARCQDFKGRTCRQCRAYITLSAVALLYGCLRQTGTFSLYGNAGLAAYRWSGLAGSGSGKYQRHDRAVSQSSVHYPLGRAHQRVAGQ